MEGGSQGQSGGVGTTCAYFEDKTKERRESKVWREGDQKSIKEKDGGGPGEQEEEGS